MRKFVGSWVAKADEDGNYEYDCIVASTLEDAHKRASDKCRKADQIEWITVREEVWKGDKRDGYWQVVSEWAGDYASLDQRL